MRIIDTHTHLPGSALGCTPRPLREVREVFEAEGLSGAWVMTLDGLLKEPARHNDILAADVSDHRDFFVPFCTVNPHDGADETTAELERAQRDLGMRGLKLHPWLQAFSVTHPAVLPVVRRAGDLRMPVLFHDGTPPYSDPLQIAYLAENAPDTTFILGHAGLDDLYRDAILACLRHPNICLCLCSLSSGRMKEIIGSCPTDRLLYGSDGGLGGPGLVASAIAKVEAACSDEKTLQAIFQDNPQRLLPL